MSIRDYQNNLTTLARRLRPFLFAAIAAAPATVAVLLNRVILIPGGTGDPSVYAKSSAGLDAALAAATSGDTVYLPPGTIAGDHEIPAGVSVGAWRGAVLSGTITANPGATLSEEIEITSLRWYEAPPQAPGGSLTLIAGTPVTIINDSANNSFPALTIMANGDLIVVYRAGTHHSTAKGTLVYRTSSDKGATWSSAATVFSDGTYDVRDPGILLTSTGRLVVTFYKADHTIPDYLLDGSYVTYSDNNGSTWSTPYNINSTFTAYSSTGSSPAIELPDGTLIATLRGENTGDTYMSTTIVFSSDNGATWGDEMLVADGETDGRMYAEANLAILPSGEILMLIRSDPADPDDGEHYRTRSRDGGLTWETPVSVYAGTGNPHMLVTKAGIIAVFYRKGTDRYVVMRTSRDNGYSWSDAVDIDNSTMRMTYASPYEYEEGVIGLAYGKETVGDQTNSDLLFVRLYVTIAAGQIDLNVPTGIAPMTVTSTTAVTNLNADLVDGYHAADLIGAGGSIGALTDWTPTVTQSGSVTVTVTYAKYCSVGPLYYVCAILAVTGTGTTANDIVIGNLPAAPAATSVWGQMWINDVGVSFYSGSAYGGSGGLSLRAHLETDDAGSDPSFALANGDSIRFVALYPAA